VEKSTVKKPLKAKRRQKRESHLEKALKFYLENKSVKQAEAYAAKGRRLKDLSLAELRERVSVAMMAYANNPNPDNRAEFGDCESEYLLRGLSFPPKGEDIEAATKMLIAKATEQGNRILSDPKLTEEIGRELLEDTAAALEEADQEKKN
jgi:hypothetical protein